MKKRILIFTFILFCLSGCGKVTTEDLLGGTWHPTKGYQGGKVRGEADCPLFETGIHFIDEEKLHIDGIEENFEYKIETMDAQDYLYIHRPTSSLIRKYPIKKISKDEIGVGDEDDSSTMSCVLERNDKNE